MKPQTSWRTKKLRPELDAASRIWAKIAPFDDAGIEPPEEVVELWKAALAALTVKTRDVMQEQTRKWFEHQQEREIAAIEAARRETNADRRLRSDPGGGGWVLARERWNRMEPYQMRNETLDGRKIQESG